MPKKFLFILVVLFAVTMWLWSPSSGSPLPHSRGASVFVVHPNRILDTRINPAAKVNFIQLDLPPECPEHTVAYRINLTLTETEGWTYIKPTTSETSFINAYERGQTVANEVTVMPTSNGSQKVIRFEVVGSSHVIGDLVACYILTP